MMSAEVTLAWLAISVLTVSCTSGRDSDSVSQDAFKVDAAANYTPSHDAGSDASSVPVFDAAHEPPDAALDANPATADAANANFDAGHEPDAASDAGRPTADAAHVVDAANPDFDADHDGSDRSDAAGIPTVDDGTYGIGPAHAIGAWGTALPCGRLADLSASSGAILDVGHSSSIVSLQAATDRLLSAGVDNSWVLWNSTDGALLARGTSAPVPISAPDSLMLLPKLAGDRFVVVSSATTLQLRSLLTGQVLTTVAATAPGTVLSSFGLGSDGSYVWAADNSGVKAWDATGAVLASATGDYSKAKVFGAPGELRIALGPAGATVIQQISTGTGAATVSPAFAGTFHSWFLDGAHFFTYVATTVRIYSDAGVSQALTALPGLDGLTGQGSFFWTQQGNVLDIYTLADASTPAKSLGLQALQTVHPAGNVLSVVHPGEPVLDIIELTKPGMPMTSVALPVSYPSIFAADPSDRWWFGSVSGALFNGSDFEHPLSCGEVYSIAGSDTGIAAIATAAGGVLLFDLGEGSRQYLGSIPFKSSHVEISIDGSILAAAASLRDDQYKDDRSLKVFALPAATTTKVWPYAWSDYPTLFFDFSMSADGQRLGHVTGNFEGTWTFTRQVLDVTGPAPSFTQTTNDGAPLQLSPDGTRVAAAVGSDGNASTGTNIYENGVLISAVLGYPVAWIDDHRLLVNRYASSGAAVGAELYDTQGVLQTAPTLPTFGPVRVVSADELYSQRHNAIYSLSTGVQTWTGSSMATVGSVAARQVVFTGPAKAYSVVAVPR